MSMMKRYLEDVSVEMGYDGEINDEVMAEGQRRMETTMESVEVGTCIGCGQDFCYSTADHKTKPDLCKGCATIACEEGLTSYDGYVSIPDPPYYVSAFKTAVPFPTDNDIPLGDDDEVDNDPFEG